MVAAERRYVGPASIWSLRTTSSRSAQTSSLWCAATDSQLADVASLRWRDWPHDEDLSITRSLEEATATARELARSRGAGHVLELEVSSDTLQRYPKDHIPTGAHSDLVASLQHAISEHAHYKKALAEEELLTAEAALGRPLPAAWRGYLQSACWFHRGRMRDGAYVWLYAAAMSVELSLDDYCPGMFVIGSDGASEQLVVDLREPSPSVLLANVVHSGWDEAFVQAPSIESFVRQVESGTFAFSFS